MPPIIRAANNPEQALQGSAGFPPNMRTGLLAALQRIRERMQDTQNSGFLLNPVSSGSPTIGGSGPKKQAVSNLDFNSGSSASIGGGGGGAALKKFLNDTFINSGFSPETIAFDAEGGGFGAGTGFGFGGTDEFAGPDTIPGGGNPFDLPLGAGSGGSEIPAGFGSNAGFGDFQNFIDNFDFSGGFNFGELFNTLIGLGPTGGGNTAGSAQFLQNLFGQGAPGLDPNLLNTALGFANNANATSLEDFAELIGGPEDFNDLLGFDSIIAQLLGDESLFGGGGGSFSGGTAPFSFFGGGGGGGVSFDPAEFAKLQALDPGLAEELAKIKEAQLAQFETFRNEEKSKLLTQLFGQGVNRSTVAGEAGDRLLSSLENTLLNIESADVQRALDLRTEKSNRFLQGGLAKLQSDTSLAGQRASGAAAAGAAASANKTQLALGKLGLLGDLFGFKSGALSDVFGSQANALSNAFNTGAQANISAADIFSQLAGVDQSNQTDFFTGLGNIAGNLLGGANTNATQAGLGNQQGFLNLLGLQNDLFGLLQQGFLTQQGFDVDKFIAQLNANTQTGIASANQPSFFDKLLGAGGALLPLFLGMSDKRAKENIKKVKPTLTKEDIKKLKGVNFNFLNTDSQESGVIAQDVQKVAPQYVRENSNGVLFVNKDALLADMIESAKYELGV